MSRRRGRSSAGRWEQEDKDKAQGVPAFATVARGMGASRVAGRKPERCKLLSPRGQEPMLQGSFRDCEAVEEGRD